MELVQITEAQKQQYQAEGYFILEKVISDEHLELLRSECQRFIEIMHAEMDAQGTDVIGINHRNKRYFLAHPSKTSQRLREFLFSDLMAEICRATIGPEAYLYWEQYVVKAAEVGMKFGWHQDSAFGGPMQHAPYVSCWCALEDMSDANGTIYVLPYSRAGTKELAPHFKEEGTNDLIGYDGPDPGEPVNVPAGSIAVFSSHTLHRSGVNSTDKMRRVYLAQYSPQVIYKKDASGLVGRDEQLLRNGERIA
jgi:ectoine hydroxylase-related dioxygenase (phytanoyl-CoA dioxygenase family)